ncbi:Nucleoporin-FG multi-domain protein [Pyrenophora teres f. maculata]|nr:Nucleoporin-FG multi-domain protein [Pyrenophora teres f. maculata]
MAGFGRSNSLSINTGGGGLFGNNNATQNQQGSQPQSSGALFGSTQQTQQPQSGSLFGGQNQTSQPSGGLFGNKPATTAPATGGLFGSSTAQSSQPQSGGLFGGALGGNTQNQTQNTTQSGGLFGGTQAKPSLFGSSTQQTTAATPSLFGNTTSNQQNNQQNQTSAPSLFGSTQQQSQPQQQQNSLFGGMNTQNRSGTLGGSTLGGNQMNASAQPVQMTLDSIRGTTRFNDLHPELQTLIQQFDEGIQRKINYCSQIRETMPKNEADIATIAPDVAYIETRLSTVEVGLDNDSANIAYLKDLVKKDAEDATLSFRAIENQRLPAQFHYRNNTNLTASSAKTPATSALDDDDPTKPVDLMGYFNRRTDELGRTLDVYQRQIREIEAHLRTMEAGTLEKAQQLTGSRSAPRDQRRELVEALKAIEGAILDSAKKVGQVRDDVTKQTLGSVGAALL